MERADLFPEHQGGRDKIDCRHSDKARRWLTLLGLGVAVAAFQRGVLIFVSHHTITVVVKSSRLQSDLAQFFDINFLIFRRPHAS